MAWNVYSQRSYPRNWVIDAEPAPPSPAAASPDGRIIYLLASTAAGMLAGITGILLLVPEWPHWVYILAAIVAVAVYIIGLAVAAARLRPWQWAILALIGSAAGAIMVSAEIQGGNHLPAALGIIGLPLLAIMAALRTPACKT